MEKEQARRRSYVRWGLAGGAVLALLILLWPVTRALLAQVFWGYLLMGAALPLCRLLERRLSPSWAATGAFAVLGLAAALVLLLLIPALVRQFDQLSQAFPTLLGTLNAMLSQIQEALAARGIVLAPMREELFAHLRQAAGQLLPRAAEAIRSAAEGLQPLMLAPLMAFYLLRDRRQISASLTLLVPMQKRRAVVLAAREMRREITGFLRGQLLLAGMVGALTGLGLAVVGTPGWLVLGVLMGIMELIPYIGPVLAGIPAVLLGLVGGWSRALWTLGVIVAVQQLENGLLSPRMLSGATRLPPLLVLLAISAGGLMAGPVGMLLALPVVVSLRGALRALRAELS